MKESEAFSYDPAMYVKISLQVLTELIGKRAESSNFMNASKENQKQMIRNDVEIAQYAAETFIKNVLL